jgi:adenosylhomocysteine nucleosidase
MIGIIGAMEEEVGILRSAMENTKSETIVNFEFISGKLEGSEAVLLRSGIGKVNAAVGCALLIDHFKPALVINTGSAGGIDPGLTFGDLVISDGLVYYDVDVTAFKYKPGQIPGQPPVFLVSEDLIRRAEKAMDELKAEGIFPKTTNHIRGLIGSGDIFMHQIEKIDAVRKTFPEIKAVEMEGAAIAHACYLFTIPVLIIRALSDIAGVESPMKSEEFLPLAAKNSAELVKRIVKFFG